MSIEPYAVANSRPPTLPAVQAEPNLLQKLHPLPAPRRAEEFFGRVEPVMQFRPYLLGASPIPALSWNTSIFPNQEDTALHEVHPALKRPWPRIVSYTNHRAFLGIATKLGTNPAAAAYAFVEDRTSITPQPGQTPLGHISSPRFPTPDAHPFLLIERVKKLLGQQKIRDARRALEIGSSRYPEDRQIASLLRAISPGRVSPTGWASTGRQLEITWIKQHGQEYRGKWIALDGDRLIALADTLNELLAKLDTSSERKKPPFIQHLMSE